MDKLKMQTVNKADENFKKLAAMFPNAITETIDENGDVVRAIDKDVLMQEISCKVVDGNEERYQFTWPDKKKSVLLANATINKTLRPVRDDETIPTGADSGGNPYCSSGSVDFDTTENLYIEGDNLEVLKLLQETYLGKIKMIYIDPPYNTGNDFVYADDFSQSTEEYLENSGQFDDEGNRLVKNLDSNGRFHTDWLNMIYTRLKIAKDLLTDDGAIFISIGDEELYNLQKVCDEIFGNRNYIANLIWQSTPGSNTGEDLKTVTENILVYCKNREQCKFSALTITSNEKYTNSDEYFEKRGGYVLNKLDRRMTGTHYSEALNYAIKLPDGTNLFPGSTTEKQEHWNWRWSKSKVEWGIKNGFIVMKKNDNGWAIYFKQYEKVNNDDKPIIRTVPYQNLINIEGANSARGTREVMNLFDGKYFDYPKPLSLMKYIQNMLLHKEDIILDFFSGSATTAHAIMLLNAEDGGHRKFVLVQLPEETDTKSEAYKIGYKNSPLYVTFNVYSEYAATLFGTKKYIEIVKLEDMSQKELAEAILQSAKETYWKLEGIDNRYQLLVHSMQYIGNIVACGQFSDEIDTQKLISEMELSEELYPILGHVFMYEDKYKWYEDLDKMMRKFVDGGVES